MNKRQKELAQKQLDSEQAVLHELEKQYRRAEIDIIRNIRILQSDELTQSKIYQLQYQQALRGVVESSLEKLHSGEFTTIQAYLEACYEDGFVGTMYDMHGQGVPLIIPLDQETMIRAITTDSKINTTLYTALGVDTKRLKRTIREEITRGLAEDLPTSEIARNIHNLTGAGLYNAKRIARTEGHRILCHAQYDAQQESKSKGADVVKQWDATLDGNTRPNHQRLDGQIREVDEPFEVAGMTAMYPGDFGRPEEDCNCRCTSLSRARWALDETELQTLKDRAEYFGLDKTEDFNDFKKRYLKAAENVENTANNGKIILPDAKLTGYALNPSAAPNKARAFRDALGYTMETADQLHQNILEHIDQTKFVEKGDSGYGMRYEFIMELTGLNGKKANVLTAWIQDGETLRLTSVYVTKRRRTE